jgi:hypothetical protein
MESIDHWQQRKQESNQKQQASSSKPAAVVTKPVFTTSMKTKTPSRPTVSTPKLDCKLTPIGRVSQTSSIVSFILYLFNN